MRVAVSLLSLRPGRVGGAETYVRALLRHLPEVADGDELVAVMDRDLADRLPVPGFRAAVVPRGAGRLVGERILEAYTPWRARAVERAVAEVRADVHLFPQQSIFPADVGGPAVLTAVDVQHLVHPGNFGLFDRTFRPRVYPRSLARATHVIAISEFTRRMLVERCGVPPAKVTAVPFGIERPAAPEGPPAPSGLVAGPYLYYPAATWPHKDHRTLLRSFAALRHRGDLAGKLVLTGERTALWRRELLPLARRLGVAADVVHLGFVPYAEVRRLMAGASAVVFPTRFEGFGLPVLEAAALGTRLVTSRLEVFDEVGVPGEAQVDFADPDALLAALRRPGPTRLARDPRTWTDTARQTMAILREAAHG